MAERPTPRRAVLAMRPYSPPTAGRHGQLRLDFNENTVGAAPRVLEHLRAHLNAADLAVYPEYGAATARLAAFFGVTPEMLLLTNGTDGAIQVLVSTYVEPGEEVVLLRPSYAMYRLYAEAAGAALREIDYRPSDLAFPLRELVQGLRPTTRAVLIANPNNPTGTSVALGGIEELLAAAPQAAVLVDEAYFEFCGLSAIGLIAHYPNLFVCRTFSKAFGLAALRLGCLMSQPENIAVLRKAHSPYSVNAVAVLAAEAAIGDTAAIDAYVAEVREAKALLYRGFAALGISYVPSDANFVLFRAGDRATSLRDALQGRGILVRDRSYELPGCVRVTVGTRAQVQQFLAALEELW